MWPFGKNDEIKQITVLSRAHNDICEFSLQMDRSFSVQAKDGLKPVLQHFILAANESLFSDCYWFVGAYDYCKFYAFNENEILEFKEQLKSAYPLILKLIPDEHTLFVLNEMSENVLAMLDNTVLPNGEKLQLDVYNALYYAFYTDDIENVLTKVENDINHATSVIEDQKIRLHIICAGIFGAKFHEITVRCDSNHRKEVKNCLVDVFNAHGIQLYFTGEDIL